MLALDFSISTVFAEALDILSSIISFIQGNTLLVSLLFLSIAVSIVFAVWSRIRG